MAEEDMSLLPEIKRQFSTFRDTQFLTNVSIGSDFGNMESEERLPCGHPVTDDYAHNDPNPGATHFCVSCAKESEE